MMFKNIRRIALSATLVAVLFSSLVFVVMPAPAQAQANRYFVMGQVFIANGTTTVTEVGRQAAAGNTTINVTGGAGNFTIYRAQGVVATVTSGTAAVTGSPVTLAAGANTITVGGNGTAILNLTLGTAANWNTVQAWAATSGGTGGASIPTSADNVFFDALSFTRTTQVVTVDAAANVLDMNWTGATNTPSISGGNLLYIYGSLTLVAGMTFNIGTAVFFNGVGVHTITTNGVTITTGGDQIYQAGLGGSYTLQDDLTTSIGYALGKGTLNTNGKTVNAPVQFVVSGADVKTLTLGASTINTGNWEYSGSNLTLTANTATINVSGTGAFAGGSIATYNNVNLNGTAHTISGNNTIVTLATPPGTTQTLTFTAGSVTKTTTATLSGDATHAHSIISGTAGTLASIWATNKTDSFVTYTDMLRNYNGVIVANCSGAGGGTFAGAGGAYTSLTMQGAGNYALTITGNNTFTTFTVDRSVANKTLILTGTTQTITTPVMAVSGTRTVTITNGTFTKAGGSYFVSDYLVISGSTATPALTWYARTPNSTDNGGNSGWEFGSPLCLVLDVDGVESVVTLPPGTAVPDNANNWTFLQNNVMPYMEYQEITIGGAQEQYIDWEYGATTAGTLTNGTGTATGSPITLNMGANTVAVTVAGTFTVALPVGSSGIATSGGGTVTGSPVYLTDGNNTITVPGGGTGNITITVSPAFNDTGTAGNNHDATPTFRTTSSDSNVSAALISLSPVTEAKVDTFVLITAADILTGVPSSIPELYTELDFTHIPGADAVNEVLASGGIPQSLWWFPFLFLGIAIIGLIVYGATAARLFQGQIVQGAGQGSLLAMCVVIEALLVVFGIMNPVPLWPAILFPIAAAAIISSTKHTTIG